MGAGGGTSDSFGSLGFLPLGFGAGFEEDGVGVGAVPFGVEVPPPNLSLIVGTAEDGAGVDGVPPLEALAGGSWMGAGGGAATA